MIYLSGVSNPAAIAAAQSHPLGLMAQPDSGYAQQIGAYPLWAGDNGCFAVARKGATFNEVAWRGWMRSLRVHRATCLFMVAPDVLHWVAGKPIGDAVATLARSAPIMPMIRALGYKAALVAQDGLEDIDPSWWDDIRPDALFIGGSDMFKLSWAAMALVREAKSRNIWCHMGRVNSRERLAKARAMGCDSADGTHLAFEPTVHLAKITKTWFTPGEIRHWRATYPAQRKAA